MTAATVLRSRAFPTASEIVTPGSTPSVKSRGSYASTRFIRERSSATSYRAGGAPIPSFVRAPQGITASFSAAANRNSSAISSAEFAHHRRRRPHSVHFIRRRAPPLTDNIVRAESLRNSRRHHRAHVIARRCASSDGSVDCHSVPSVATPTAEFALLCILCQSAKLFPDSASRRD